MKKEKRKLVSFTLDSDIIKELSMFSKTSGINKSKVVEFALKDKFLKEQEKNKLDSIANKLELFKTLQDSNVKLDIEWVLMNILNFSKSDVDKIKNKNNE